MNLWRMIQRCVVVVFVALQSLTWTSMATALAMANIVVATVGCAATPVAQRYPQARVEKVCVRPPGIEPDAAHWVYADSGAVVSSEHPEVFDRIARRGIAHKSVDLNARELKPHAVIWTFAPRANKRAPRRTGFSMGGSAP